jgi:hypothetical protein
MADGEAKKASEGLAVTQTGNFAFISLLKSGENASPGSNHADEEKGRLSHARAKEEDLDTTALNAGLRCGRISGSAWVQAHGSSFIFLSPWAHFF